MVGRESERKFMKKKYEHLFKKNKTMFAHFGAHFFHSILKSLQTFCYPLSFRIAGVFFFFFLLRKYFVVFFFLLVWN